MGALSKVNWRRGLLDAGGYLLGSVLFATAVLSFLMKQSQGMEALQMLIGEFVIFMIPQVVGSVAVFLELVAATIRQVWYI